VPVLSGWTVAACEGDGRVQRVRVTRGRKSRTFGVDAVAVSHGLVPAIELARTLGCADQPVPRFPAAVVTVDASQATSTAGVFACGELTGVGGAAKAEPEGTVAGYSAARSLGFAGDASHQARAARAAMKVRKAAAFSVELIRLFPVDGAEVPSDETLVCRCEEVSAVAVADAVAAGARDLRAVKGLTRCGMGYCQGRVCGPVAQLLVARLSGRPLAAVGDLHTRHIAVPVTVAELAQSGGEA
jgi:NAD(P)H-nitrite reductase large subunit